MIKDPSKIKKLYYSIGEVSKITELKQYVLRYWETEFKELSPSKNKAGNRTYRQKDIDLINKIKDLLYNQKFTIVKGGKGGLGNSHFKSSTNRTPRQHTKGQDSEEMWVWLSLKLIADVGIIGLPNAGKSTLLSKFHLHIQKLLIIPLQLFIQY